MYQALNPLDLCSLMVSCSNVFGNRGFIGEDGRSTRSGRIAVRCPVLDPIWFRAIEEGAKLGCAMDILDIAVVCSTKRPIPLSPPNYQAAASAARAAYTYFPSDHLALVNAFNLYLRVHEKIKDEHALRVWCKLHFLDFGGLEEARKARLRVGPFLAQVAKLAPSRASITDTAIVRKALAIAFCTRIAIYHGPGDEYRTVPENVSVRLEPRSALVNKNHPWIVYTSLTMISNRHYLEVASPIEAEWLVVCAHLDKLL